MPEVFHIKKYAFEDKKKEVKLYIDLSEAPFNAEDEILESMITFEPLEQSFKLTVVNPRSQTFLLEIKQLNDKIEPSES